MRGVFELSNLLVMPFWFLMVVLPGARLTQRLVRSVWCVVPAAALYAVLVLPRLGELLPALASPSLDGVVGLLGSEPGATIGWTHFLAFDLLVGRWAYLDSRDRGLPWWISSPILLTVLMLGPLGWLLHLGGRESWARLAGGDAIRGVPAVRGWIGSMMRVNAPLAVLALALVPLAVATLVGVVVDPREVTGAPAWVKPAKFAISISVYSFTLLWMLSRVRGRSRAVWWTGTISALALGVEWVVIALQASRGIRSHFNFATPLDIALTSTMGLFVMVLWLGNLAAALLLMTHRGRDRAFTWSIRLGLVSALMGGVMAMPMLSPTPAQMEAFRSGVPPAEVGSHSIGVADGGAGIPFVGWSTEGGDLRVPHFFALHGLQIIPLLGWLLARRMGEAMRRRMALTWTAGVGYLGFCCLLFWQAMRGEPVLSPGGPVLFAGGLLAAGVAGAVLWLTPRTRRSPGSASALRTG